MLDTTNNIAEIEFFCKDLPQWSINQFLQSTTTNYMKIYTLRKMIELFQEGANDSNFIIGTNSINVYSESFPIYEKEKDFIVFTSKEKSAEKFWHYFKYLRRPIIIYRKNNNDIPLYNLESKEALTLTRLIKNSPPQLTIQASINSLVDLFRGKLFATRDNEILSQSIENLRNILELSRLIEDNNTPEGVKVFARDQVEAIMNHQDRINKRLGINKINFLL